MSVKHLIKLTLEKITGASVLRSFPRGMVLNQDIKAYLPGYTARTVFDVGANVGQSAKQFVRWFPKAEIYCFEPFSATFKELRRATRLFDNVHCFPVALGASKAQARINVTSPLSAMNSIRNDGSGLSILPDSAGETIEIESLSDFCCDQRIEKINMLKIDTEGYDLDVLIGAADMLNKRKVDIVQVEAGMNPKNYWHVPMEKLKAYLEDKGYFLFGVYEQKNEWIVREPHLRRADLVFISEDVIAGNKK